MTAENFVFTESKCIIEFFDFIIDRALSLDASDIHIERKGDSSLVRFRIDGLMKDMFTFDPSRHRELVTRIKILSNMDISERFLPQDGRLSFKGRSKIDFRVTSLPLINEEKVVIRILNSEKNKGSFDQLGFSLDDYEIFRRVLASPNGLFLSTGPTGSGKSTTLYTLLGQLNKEEKNIITIEDPVEYRIDGVNQIEVKEKRGMTFDKALPSILRSDPDIIMIGEIRDSRTAEISVRSAITGHLVLSSLHTYDSFSSVIRLMDMGIEPYLIASSLLGAQSQRLVMKLDPQKTCDYYLTDDEKIIFENVTGIDDFSGFKAPLDRASYKGRTAISEAFLMDDELVKLIKSRADISEFRTYSKKINFKSMFYRGLIKAKEGKVYIKDVIDLCLGGL